MEIFKGKKIIVGVTGSIAAYKACNLVRALKGLGAEVFVATTQAAINFVGTKTFQTLSANKVFTNLFSDDINHVEWAKDADLFVVAPTTANSLAKFVQGFADDAVSSLFLSVNCPILLCPAMHTAMWQNPAVVENVATLRSRNINILNPEVGELSMGDFGEGRLPHEDKIVNFLGSMLVKPSLKGRKIMISAGPTIEAIDKVRFISNKSSGKMGVALVKELYLRGAEIVLVSSLNRSDFLDAWDDRLKFIKVESALEMLKAMESEFASVDTVISVAAVADFRPTNFYDGKLPKDKLGAIETSINDDILASLSSKRTNQKIVGFVLRADDESVETEQTEHTEQTVLAKIAKKGLDICLSVTSKALGADNMSVDLYVNGAKKQLGELKKTEIASKLADLL